MRLTAAASKGKANDKGILHFKKRPHERKHSEGLGRHHTADIVNRNNAKSQNQQGDQRSSILIQIREASIRPNAPIKLNRQLILRIKSESHLRLPHQVNSGKEGKSLQSDG